MSFFLLGITALVLGLRHGIDIDHIAAILDMAGTSAAEKPTGEKQPRRFTALIQDMKLPALYILGHALMLVLLGMIAVYFGAVIPAWLDAFMERTVGVTLLLLSGYLIYSLTMYATKGHEFKLRSRWMVLFALVLNLWAWLEHKLFKHQRHEHKMPNWDNRGAFAVGMIHGFGAETGTQVLLLASVAGVGSSLVGTYMLAAFTLGMIASTMGVALCVSAGLAGSKYFKPVVIVLGVLAALFSLVVGLYFAFGHGDLLPSLT